LRGQVDQRPIAFVVEEDGEFGVHLRKSLDKERRGVIADAQ
jgi:hypothetical protein